MNEKALHTLEFDKIVDFLQEYAATPLGKDSCKNLVPLTDIDEIRTMQRQTSDAVSRLFARGPVSFAGIKDIRGSLMRLRIGSSLGIPELLAILLGPAFTTQGGPGCLSIQYIKKHKELK